MGFNCLKARATSGGSSTKFLEIPGTHFIDFGKIKGWVDLGATKWFEYETPGLGIQHLNQ